MLGVLLGVSMIVGSCQGELAYAKEDKALNERVQIAVENGLEE